jgi:hypothetical protein
LDLILTNAVLNRIEMNISLVISLPTHDIFGIFKILLQCVGVDVIEDMYIDNLQLLDDIDEARANNPIESLIVT